MTRNMYRINNKSNGVVRMYVTTSCFLVFLFSIDFRTPLTVEADICIL